jgi:type II secretory pathway pseudopilin PulG
MKNQKGFAVLEGLLVLIIIGMLAGIGWYVMRASKNTNNILNSASTSSTKSAAKKTSSAGATKYLSIDEWGVKIPLSEKDQGAYYKVDTDLSPSQTDPTNITVYASEIDDLTGPAGISCKGEYVAYLIRLPKDDPKWQESKTVDDGNVSPLFGNRTVVGSYKYAVATKKQYGPGCWATSKTGGYDVDAATSQKFADVVSAFSNDFKSITAK